MIYIYIYIAKYYNKVSMGMSFFSPSSVLEEVKGGFSGTKPPV